MSPYKLNTCTAAAAQKTVTVSVCVSPRLCFQIFQIFLSCFSGALRHTHPDTLCWEVTHGWKGQSPRGATHDPRNHPLGASWYCIDPGESEEVRKTCILTFITKKSRTITLLLSALLYDSLHFKISLRYEGHLDSIFPTALKTRLSHQMLKSLPVHKRPL